MSTFSFQHQYFNMNVFASIPIVPTEMRGGDRPVSYEPS